VLLLEILKGGWQMSSRHDVGICFCTSLIYASLNLDDCRLPVAPILRVYGCVSTYSDTGKRQGEALRMFALHTRI
jgi:hypothetical protein